MKTTTAYVIITLTIISAILTARLLKRAEKPHNGLTPAHFILAGPVCWLMVAAVCLWLDARTLVKRIAKRYAERRAMEEHVEELRESGKILDFQEYVDRAAM